MKRLPIIFFLALASTSWSQSVPWPQIDSVEVLPTVPVEGENVKAVLHVTMGTTSGWLGATSNVAGGIVNIESCYMLIGFTAITSFADTIDLGPLDDGSYTISFSAYGSLNTVDCDYQDTSSYIEFLTVEPDPFAEIDDRDDQGQRLEIFPNPTNGVLNIDSDKNIESLIIHNSLGEMVIQIEDPGKTVDLNDLGVGAYIIQIADKNGIVRKRLLIQ